MRIKKIFLGITSTIAAGVLVAACSGGEGDDTIYRLDSGTYNFDTKSLPTDTCFDEDIDTLIAGIDLEIDIEGSEDDTTWTLIPPEAAAGILPPIEGTKDGNTLFAEGSVIASLGSGCILEISAQADGEMTGAGEFDATITANISANVTSSGNVSDCSAWEGESLPGDLPIPFPTLSNPANGECDIVLDGEATLLPE